MRPLRNRDPSLYRLISIRTCGARMFMTPSRNIEKLIGGILARYQEIFGIEIYAYFFLSNHYHLLIRSPKGNTDEFLENLNREIALRINRKLGRQEKFWSRRYDDIQVGDAEGDLLRAFLYVTTNATRHGLLENSGDWPGLNSIKHCVNGKDRFFTFYHYSAGEGEEKTTRHTLKLSTLPEFEVLTTEERKLKIKTLLNEKMEEYKKARNEEGKGFLGLKGFVNQDPYSIPQKTSRSKRPVCYTQCIETLIRKRKEARARRSAYDDASFDYRLGYKNFEFPEFSFKPPLHRAPRFEPFKPLSRVDFLN